MRRPLKILALSTTAAAVLAGSVGGAGCSDLRIADVRDEAGTDGPDGGSGGADATGGGDASSGEDGAVDAPPGPLRYDDVQAALQSKRFPGPVTAPGSKGYCTSKYFVWRESDGTLHSWAAKTQARIDYVFKAGGNRPYFVPSDSFVTVDVLPDYAQLNVYRTDAPNTLVTALPYSFNFVSSNDGVIRLDQTVNNVDLGGTKVRRWNASTGVTEDISAVLDTRQPHSSFVNDALVIPGGFSIPFPLYIVDVAKKTTSSVTFDGAIALQQTEQGAGGLVVHYTRNGTSGSAMRVYKKNLNDAASRFELADEVANRPLYFADGPNLEHKFITQIATWNQRVLYGSAYGIWSYDLVSGALAPVQLAATKNAGVPDVMCLLKDTGTLVYRMSGDTVGQLWAVPLSAVTP